MKPLFLLFVLLVPATTGYAQAPETDPRVYFYGLCTDDANNPRLGFWETQDASYTDEYGLRCKTMIPITPINKDSILNRYGNIDRYAFKGRYENYTHDFLQMLLTISADDLSAWPNLPYLVAYWTSFIADAKNNVDMGAILLKLSSIELEKQVPEKQVNTILQYRLNALYEFYLSVGKYAQACMYRLKMMQNKDFRYNDFQTYLQGLFWYLTFTQDASCKECVRDLRTIFIDQYNTNRETLYENSTHVPVEVEVMLADFISHYLQDDDLANIALTIKHDFSAMLLTGSTPSDQSTSAWYKLLNELYMNGYFKKEQTIAQLKEDLQHNRKIKTDDDKYIARMEYFCYYSLYRLLYEQVKPQEVLPKLQEVERLGVNPSFKTYSRIEKHIASFILNNVNKQATHDITPPSIKLLALPTKTENASIRIEGVLADQSEIRFLKVNTKEVSVENDGSFSLTLSLNAGTNEIVITCEDVLNNAQTQTHTVVYEQPVAEFERRQNMALLFAINDYDEESGWKDLSNPISDAEKLATELVRYGFDTLIIRNPSKEDYYRYIYRYVETYVGEPLNKYNQFLLFYSGHGQYDPKLQRGFLAFRNSKEKKEEDYYKASYVSYAEVIETLDRLNCYHVLFISDACYSGSFFKNIAMKGGDSESNELSKNEIKQKMEYKSRLFIGSAGLEESPDNSDLMRNLLESFRSNRNGVLTYTQLVSDIEHVKPLPTCGGFGENEPGFSFMFVKKDSFEK